MMAAITHRLILLSFAASVILLVGCGNGGKLFADAQHAMEDDDVEGAARLYQEVIIQAPGTSAAAEAHYKLAQIYYLRLKDVEAARDSLIAVLQDYPASTVERPARTLLARLYEEVFNEPDKALAQYRSLLDGAPDEDSRRRTQLAIGHCYYEMKDLESAKNAYRAAIAPSYHPDTDGAYLRLANLERLTGETKDSLGLLRELQAKTGDPERRQDAMLSEIEILMSTGRFVDAHTRLRQAEVAFPLSSEIDELSRRLTATETLLASLDGDGEEALLQEEQKKIRWGGGRRRRRPAADKP